VSDPDSQREILIEVDKLSKTFAIGLFRRRHVSAVKSVSFSVRRGEIVGFLGPNGSGKTTTIKMLLGHIAPSGGTARMFGERIGALAARKRLGFLPENPYVFPYLTPREFVEMSGRLSGMTRTAVRRESEQALDRTGVLYAADRPVRKLSKGMLQRSALAAALVAGPEMLVLDEPMSGLDPVGRKEVRNIIFEERERGRTIFFSTHILADVEALCDHVVILRGGEVVVKGAIRKVLRGDVLHTNVTVAGLSKDLEEKLSSESFSVQRRPDVQVIEVEGQRGVAELLERLLAENVEVLEVVPRRETLEDLFMRQAL